MADVLTAEELAANEPAFTVTDPPQAVDHELIEHPDKRVMRLHRREPPALPLHVFGPEWQQWIEGAAEAAACPPDYVLGPLLAAASSLVGNARWAQATPGWAEPPHLWTGAVGDSGSSKSPGADALLRDVMPRLEQRALGDYPDRHREWQVSDENHTAQVENWKKDVRTAQKSGAPPPPPPTGRPPVEPQEPRLRLNDVTIEKIAMLLATTSLKGLLVTRDELAGWLQGMNAYNDAGRSFWIEAYGGRPYRVERVKHPEPIRVSRLAVSVYGSTQPDKLTPLMREADDGLLARFLWLWPNQVEFSLSRRPPEAAWAAAALDRLRLLELAPETEPDEGPRPLMVPLAEDALPELVTFSREMQAAQEDAGGLMRSALGKARGTALRLSLVIEFLWWCGQAGMKPPPTTITRNAFLAAAGLVADYFMPMAERVYGDAAARPADRNAATLARWIVKTHPTEIHVRHLQREVRLPGLEDAGTIHAACAELVASGWLFQPVGSGTPGRPKAAYTVNPRVWGDVR